MKCARIRKHKDFPRGNLHLYFTTVPYACQALRAPRLRARSARGLFQNEIDKTEAVISPRFFLKKKEKICPRHL